MFPPERSRNAIKIGVSGPPLKNHENHHARNLGKRSVFLRFRGSEAFSKNRVFWGSRNDGNREMGVS